MYTVTLIDVDSCEMARCADIRNLNEARSVARSYLKDPEYIDDASHALIENDDGEIVDQLFGTSNRAPTRDADHVDGYDRDDIGESPDF